MSRPPESVVANYKYIIQQITPGSPYNMLKRLLWKRPVRAVQDYI